MHIRTFIPSVLVFGLLAASASSQHKRAKSTNERAPSTPLVSKDKPTVFITFERKGELPPIAASESNERIWLRLNNNLRWPIVVRMSGVPSTEYGEALLFYDVLVGNKVTIEDRCHVCSITKLKSRGSLVFSIPAENLGSNMAIRVMFNYGWEDSNSVTAGLEPEHYVYFYSSQLVQAGRDSRN